MKTVNKSGLKNSGNKQRNNSPLTIRRAVNAAILGAGAMTISSSALALDVPNGLFIDDDLLFWNSNAPSINVYENGNYVATIHNVSSFGPVMEGSSYQLVAHDFGNDFTPLSAAIVASDEDEDEDEDDNDEDESEYSEAKIYFELNDTDGDLGLHASIDGDAWRTLEIEGPNGVELMSVEVTAGLQLQGMTEIFFESDEPTFDEVPASEVFARFPAGEYEISGDTTDGGSLESTVELSHIIPAAPGNIMASGHLLDTSGGCEESDGPLVSAPYVISWDPVSFSHASLGVSGVVTPEIYQVVLEREEPTALHITIDVAADQTSVTMPPGLIGSGENLKIEVLTIADTGNQSASETCFVSAD